MSDRGLIDTSVAIVLEEIDPRRLPTEIAISSLTLAELSSGPLRAKAEAERARRLNRLQRFEAGLESLDFDPACARAYSHVFAATLMIGRKARGRAVDLLIAATALAHELPLYTLNAADLRGLDDLVEIVDLA